ncbi:MAG: rhodanese-like domain-containing protein [Methyloligellaceae bacterium]
MAFRVRKALIVATAVTGLVLPEGSALAAAIRAVSQVHGKPDVVIDTRPVALCEAASIPGARCLPPRDVLGPHRRLANVSGLLWLLGTVGLTGRETVLVAGGPARDRDFMAGLLFLAGQKSVLVLTTPIAKIGTELKPGATRSVTREAVYQAPMRSDRIVLRSELVRMIRSEASPVILDGRSEGEYWGAHIRAARGGHIPGAQHGPIPSLGDIKAGQGGPSSESPMAWPIVYGHDARDGLAFLARLVAAGRDARVYAEGWSGWASDGALPADSATYPDLGKSKATARAPVSRAASRPEREARWRMAGLVLAGLGLAAFGYLLGRRTATRTG